MKAILRRILISLFGILVFSAAKAEYPNKPITLIVPFAAGSATDSIARIVANGLSKRLGQPVIVESKPGATGRIGTEYAARAAPDGYTLLMATSGSLAVNPALFKNTRYDSIKDFSPILLVGEVPFALVANNSLPPKSIADLVAYAKLNALFYAYASPTAQVSSEIFLQMANSKATGVSYKSSPQAALGLISGETQFYFIDFGTGLSHIKSGKIHPLAVAGNRTELLPGVPAIGETVPGFSITSWNGILAPSGVPKAIIVRLNNDLREVLKQPEIRESLNNMGFEILGTGAPDEFGTLIKSDMEKWSQWIEKAGIDIR